MTRREKRAVIRAMQYIHADENNGGNYETGMDILAKLAGLPTTLSDVLKNLHAVSMEEIATRPNSQFLVTPVREAAPAAEKATGTPEASSPR